MSALVLSAAAHATIYTCIAADGSRVFSDRKCGPDAKPVKGLEGVVIQKKKTPKVAAKKLPPHKSDAELAALLGECDAGDQKACSTWALSGGPNALKAAEERAELACEAGSLDDCEQRFCKDGPTETCRQSVLRTARLSGDTWYLRAEEPRHEDGSQVFEVRCIRRGQPKTHDVAITCTAAPSRNCFAAPGDSFAGIREAAASYCRK